MRPHTQAMRDMALAKARELEQLCIGSRISPPHTGPLLAELDRPGQVRAGAGGGGSGGRRVQHQEG